ncbi:hypothetical protein WISP_00504 [Willisornis vidua]|uniref:MHC class I-like antigen recognition-like domain-containing protein n=1 Tax=Willisornis vidua TaxID=1566151 RepID=A0ABQ9E1D1_9PASS|nr:hypothetical protein WISP_00504 [Willisornis vidua]
MQSPHSCLLLFLFYFFLISGTWATMEDPFMVQYVGGCELYPNSTSRFFASVPYNGQDFLRFDTDNAIWTLSQDTNLSWFALAIYQEGNAFTEMLEIICVDNLKLLLHSGGRATLERQGETTLTLQHPPQTPGAKP